MVNSKNYNMVDLQTEAQLPLLVKMISSIAMSPWFESPFLASIKSWWGQRMDCFIKNCVVSLMSEEEGTEEEHNWEEKEKEEEDDECDERRKTK